MSPLRTMPRRRAGAPSQLRYALATLVLVPVTVASVWWFGVQEQAPGVRPARSVDSGETRTYEDVAWKLEGIRKGPANPDEELPKRSSVVYAVLSVQPRTPEAAKRIEDCRVGVVDDNGREWSGWDSAGLPQLTERAPDGCFTPAGEYRSKPITAGERQRVLGTFVVPEEVAGDVRPRVLGGEGMRPLVFDR